MTEPTTLQDNFAQYLATQYASVGVTPPKKAGDDVAMRAYDRHRLVGTYIVNEHGKVKACL